MWLAESSVDIQVVNWQQLCMIQECCLFVCWHFHFNIPVKTLSDTCNLHSLIKSCIREIIKLATQKLLVLKMPEWCTFRINQTRSQTILKKRCQQTWANFNLQNITNVELPKEVTPFTILHLTSENELKKLIMSDNYKTCDQDPVPIKILKSDLLDCVLSKITEIFNASIT